VLVDLGRLIEKLYRRTNRAGEAFLLVLVVAMIVYALAAMR